MRGEPAYQEIGNSDMDAYVEKQDLENCACMEEDGLAMTLVLEPSHPQMLPEMVLVSHLHIFNIKDVSLNSPQIYDVVHI